MCIPAFLRRAPVPPDTTPLRPNVLKWVVSLPDNQTMTYGDVHDMIHRDVAIGNDYRKERIKLLTALATGVFALTVTFHKDLFAAKVTNAGLIWLLAGWSLLLVSLLAGIEHFRKWEDFYLQHRASGIAVWRYRTAADDAGRAAATVAFNASEQKIDNLRKSYQRWNRLQSFGLLAGLACVGVYVGLGALNFSRISEPKSLEAAPIAGAKSVQPDKK